MSDAELVIVRHADTDWTASGQHTGHTDLPLNEAGRAAATGLTERLARWSFVAVWCSPLRRAVQTCELAGYGERAERHAELVEWDYGAYEGVTSAQIDAERPGWDLWRDGCPDGESGTSCRSSRRYGARPLAWGRLRAGVLTRSLPARADRPLGRARADRRRVLRARPGGDRGARSRARPARRAPARLARGG